MKILVTGSRGFLGKNLVFRLRERGYTDIVEFHKDSTFSELRQIICDVDFVFHLAGVNRPRDVHEFTTGNVEFTERLLKELGRYGDKVPIVISSSIHAENSSPYGESKARSEQAVFNYRDQFDARVYVYRLPNIFGKWCKPNYNSAVATFCYNIANDLPVEIHDKDAALALVYVDDVCDSFISLLEKDPYEERIAVSPVYQCTVGDVVSMLQQFKAGRDTLTVEEVGVGFSRALYSTYLSYLTPDKFCYDIPVYGDERGVFSEMIKTSTSGQISFFTARPGVTRGGHYHHSKNEKFLVIKGKARFKFEHIITEQKHCLEVDDRKLSIVETVPGWSHDITNIGDEEMIVMLWANEIFDKNMPDTYARPLT